MKRLALAVAIVALGATALIATAIAKNGNGGGRSFNAKLTGFEEIVSPTQGAISTDGNGRFRARLRQDRIEFELRYEDLEGTNTTGAHIHFSQPHVVGGIVVPLCADGTCPDGEGTVTGTITAANVITVPGQGIAAGEFDELIRAMRHGATYVNVHTNLYPGGEIRGQIDHGRHHGRGNKHND